jgi:hypothetical protein
MKIIIAVLFLAVMWRVKAQENKVISNLDSPQTVTLSQFNRLIDSCTFLLRTTPISKISDSGHIYIIKCSNTIEYASVQKSGERRFKGSRYQDFMKLLLKKNYLYKIAAIYPIDKWNSRSGYYFTKLRVGYKSAANCSLFKVSEP